jgi:hypothetical protein
VAGGTLVLFVGLIVWHARVLRRRDESESRRDVHVRHIKRRTGEWLELPASGTAEAEHAYAGDIDLCGANSLCQRIDVSHTVAGEATLARWLSSAAPLETVRARQTAVAELAEQLDLREALEADAGRAHGERKIDPAPFLSFVKLAPFVFGNPGLKFAAWLLPPTVLGLYVASVAGFVPPLAWLIAGGVQALLALGTAGRCAAAFQLVAARRGYVEALQRMLVRVESASWKAETLTALQKRMAVGGKPPSAWMARLDRWAGFAELYTQFPLHFFVNIAVLWDLNVLLQLERWNEDVGEGLPDAFEALAELEALASLASLLARTWPANRPCCGRSD